MLNPEVTPTFSPLRAGHYVCPSTTNLPLTTNAGTGSAYSNTSLSDGAFTATLLYSNQPETARELIVFQKDNSGTSLSIDYVLKYTTWDGTKQIYTFTLTSTTSLVFAAPCVFIDSLTGTITNSGASDAIKVGYRGYWANECYPTAIGQVLIESVAGAIPATAGTIPQAGFYLPNSISSTNSIELWTVTAAKTPGFSIKHPIGFLNTPTKVLGTNPSGTAFP